MSILVIDSEGSCLSVTFATRFRPIKSLRVTFWMDDIVYLILNQFFFTMTECLARAWTQAFHSAIECAVVDAVLLHGTQNVTQNDLATYMNIPLKLLRAKLYALRHVLHTTNGHVKVLPDLAISLVQRLVFAYNTASRIMCPACDMHYDNCIIVSDLCPMMHSLKRVSTANDLEIIQSLVVLTRCVATNRETCVEKPKPTQKSDDYTLQEDLWK